MQEVSKEETPTVALETQTPTPPKPVIVEMLLERIINRLSLSGAAGITTYTVLTTPLPSDFPLLMGTLVGLLLLCLRTS
jgi:hypothetical protein